MSNKSPGRRRRKERREAARRMESGPPVGANSEPVNSLRQKTAEISSVFAAGQLKGENQTANQPSKAEPSEGTSGDSNKESAAGNGNHVLVLAFDIIGTGVFGLLANMWFSTGHKASGVIFTYIAIILGLLAIVFAVTWNWPKWSKRTWALYSVLAGMLLIATASWSIVIWTGPKTNPSVEPIITVDPGPKLLTGDPFPALFILENHGPGTIYHIQHSAWWNDPNGPGKRMLFAFGMTDEVATLAPFVKQELLVNPSYVSPTMGSLTRMDIQVTYTDVPKKSDEKTNIFQFRLSNVRGNYTWIPFGEGEPIEKAIARTTNIPGPQSLIETNPFIKLSLISFTRLNPKSEEALEMEFAVQNTGGKSAKNMRFEWAAIRADNGLVLMVTPQGNQLEFNKQLLVPGATITNDCYFSNHSNGPDVYGLYDGALSNGVFWLGKFHYEDNSGQLFEKAFRIIRTNNEFTLQYHDPRTIEDFPKPAE